MFSPQKCCMLYFGRDSLQPQLSWSKVKSDPVRSDRAQTLYKNVLTILDHEYHIRQKPIFVAVPSRLVHPSYNHFCRDNGERYRQEVLGKG